MNIHDIFKHVDVRPDSECWEWKLSVTRGGYGQFRVKQNGRWTNKYTHRTAYELRRGQIPSNMLVCHTCDNRRCCNPNHLFLGTPLDNTRDAQTKNGANWNKSAKLTNANVLEILHLLKAGLPAKRIARGFGVDKAIVLRIKHNKIWRWIDGPR